MYVDGFAVHEIKTLSSSLKIVAKIREMLKNLLVDIYTRKCNYDIQQHANLADLCADNAFILIFCMDDCKQQ